MVAHIYLNMFTMVLHVLVITNHLTCVSFVTNLTSFDISILKKLAYTHPDGTPPCPNSGCWHFEKGATHVSDHVHHGSDGLLHVLVVTVHLLLVFYMTHLTSLDAGILKKVQHMYLIMFTMVLMDSFMSLFSPYTWSMSSGYHPRFLI